LNDPLQPLPLYVTLDEVLVAAGSPEPAALRRRLNRLSIVERVGRRYYANTLLMEQQWPDLHTKLCQFRARKALLKDRAEQGITPWARLGDRRQ